MANTAAHLVDRVLPNVPVRQWVLSLPYELRRLAAFDARALSAIGRIFVDTVFAHYRSAFDDARCGAVTFVQRFGGSLNLNVHFHVVVLDGVFMRRGEAVSFHEAAAPTTMDLDGIVRETSARIVRWLERHGHLEPRDEMEPDALAACAAAAMQRGLFAELPQRDDDKPHDIPPSHAAAEHMGFNLHAGVRMAASDDIGRERLCRYGARPALAVGRFRQLRDGKIAYRTKYARKGRAQHRIMTPLELLARISALIPPPRYPLVRYHGVLAPSSSWRKYVIPKPPERKEPCPRNAVAPTKPHPPQERPRPPTPPGPRVRAILLAPNILSVPHWRRLGEGALRAASPRIDWPLLLRRTFDVDVLECAKCKGRLKVKAVLTERSAVEALLSRLNITPPPKPARARDPTTLFESVGVD